MDIRLRERDGEYEEEAREEARWEAEEKRKGRPLTEFEKAVYKGDPKLDPGGWFYNVD